MNHPINPSANQLINYLLHLADSSLIMAQRSSEWCGHGPVLEQDIAITNISLDLLGQARHFYQYATERINQSADHPLKPATEDSLAYLRGEREFKNLLITELPKGDWGQTILKHFFFSVYQSLLYTRLQSAPDKDLAAIAAKSLKETAYHVKWSSEWVIRLGDGTEESHQRMLTAIEEVWPYTGEMFRASDFELGAAEYGAIDPSELHADWMKEVQDIFAEATLPMPSQSVYMHVGGKSGLHTENLGYILAEMQYLQRVYPGAEW